MAIEDTALWNEVTQITMSGERPVHFYWTADIIANGIVVPATKLLNKDNERLYDQNFGDSLVVEISMGLGTYNRRVFPYRENLQMTLTRTPIGENSTDQPQTAPVVVQTYRAIPVGDSSALVEGNHPIVHDEEFADLSNMMQYKFQLLDEAGEQVRLAATGGVFHQSTPGNVLRTLLTQVSQSVSSSQVTAIKGVEMVEPDNLTLRDHVVIPHGTRLVHLAEYLQKKCGGIYNAGIACYLQNGIWYVYPEFNTTRYEKTPFTLTVINIPPQKLPSVERTYRTTGKQTIIIATGDTAHQDLSERKQLNVGNGVRFNDSNKLFEGFGSTTGNQTTISRAQNASEFKNNARGTKLNNVQVGPQRFTDNHFAQLSDMTQREGAYVQLAWEHSESGLLYPGQPVRYFYVVGDEIKEAYGLVARVHEYTHQVTPGMTTKRHVSNSAVTLFIKRELQWDATP